MQDNDPELVYEVSHDPWEMVLNRDQFIGKFYAFGRRRIPCEIIGLDPESDRLLIAEDCNGNKFFVAPVALEHKTRLNEMEFIALALRE